MTGSAARADLEGHRTAIAVVALLAFSIAARPAVDPDFWWHLRSGQWMVSHHAILRSDPFSYTSVGVHQPFEWIAQLGLYGVWATLGLTGVALVVAAAAVVWTFVIYGASEGPPSVRAPVVALACVAGRFGWTARPQVVTWILTALTMLVMVTLRRAGPDADRYRTRLWFLVPLFVLWGNCHLCWFYGLAVLWITLGGELVDRARGRAGLPRKTLRSLAQVSMVSSLAVMVSAVGPRSYVLIVTGGELGKRLGISEYRAPSPRSVAQLPFFLLVALTGAVLVLRRREVSAADVGLVVLTGVLALTTVRAVPFFATVAGPVTSRYLAHLWAARPSRRRGTVDAERVREPTSNRESLLAIAIVAMVGVVAVAMQLSGRNLDRALRARYPVAAVEWIQQNHPAGPLFNEYNWGGYLIWHLPTYQVSLDGRAELYVDLLAGMRNGHGGEIFRREGVQLVLAQTDGTLARGLSSDSNWRVSYSDKIATVMTRDFAP